MRIAVTGATGHIGNVLVRDLLKNQHEVTVLIRTGSSSIDGLPLKFVKGDITDKNSLEQLVTDSEVVIHCAALISIAGDRHGMLKAVNVKGTELLLDISLRSGIKKFIHLSSIHVYDQRPTDEPLNESRPFVNHKASPYDQSKRDGQLMALRYAKKGLDVCILNPAGVIGPFDFRPSLMGQAIIDLCNGKIPALFEGGFNFVDVRDISSAIISALDKGRTGESYLLGGHFIRMIDIAQMLSKISGRRINPPKLPIWLVRAGIPFIKFWSAITNSEPLYTGESVDALQYGNRYIDSSKAIQEFKFHARPFEETLIDTYHWFYDRGLIKITGSPHDHRQHLV